MKKIWMKVLEKWNQLTLSTKYVVIVSGMVFVILNVLGFVIFELRKGYMERSHAIQMERHVDDLYDLLEFNLRTKNETIQLAISLASELMDGAGELSLDSVSGVYNAINQENNTAHNVEIFPLLLNGSPLYNNHTIVDQIMQQSGVSATIFQRTDNGFLRISTNVRDHEGQRAVDTYVPNSSPVAQALLSGETFKGRAWVVNEYFITAYQPLLIDGYVEGAIFVGVPEKDIGFFAEKFENSRYLGSGFPLLMDSDGHFVLHPYQQGNNISATALFAAMNNQRSGMISYSWPDHTGGVEDYRIFFRYFEPYENFVAINITEEDYIERALREERMMVVALIFVSMFIVFIVTYLAMKRITAPIKELSMVVEKLALGANTANYETHRKDEIGQIALSLNKLINGLKDTAGFAHAIEKKQFDYSFTPLSQKDILGKALMDMRESLRKAEEEEEKRKIEDSRRNWATEGLAKFSDILRQNNDKLEELSFQIIRNMVKYLNANQGGLFVLNDDDAEQMFLELTACYAFDRKKFLEIKILPGEGLAGTCFLEKKTIYLKKVPQDYLQITSGLGEANPDNLLIVPLMLNDQVFGVMEIATFNEFQNHQIEFVEKIAESIASTLSSVRINLRTAQLLEQSQQQAEEMRAQEEEMRQNMEEMQATQEEMERRAKEQKLKDRQMEELNKAMAERLKELDGMNKTIAILQSDQPLNAKLDSICHILPNAWHYPEDTVAVLEFNDYRVLSRQGFTSSPWCLRQDFSITPDKQGFVAIYYTQKFPELDEGPFLKEERDLINNITHLIKEHIITIEKEL